MAEQQGQGRRVTVPPGNANAGPQSKTGGRSVQEVAGDWESDFVANRGDTTDEIAPTFGPNG